jgi:hypothetical protein
MKSIRILAAFVLVLGVARADEVSPPSAEQSSLQGYATAAPRCVEWSDGCAVCARAGDGAAQCSTPGIACQPGPIVCTKEKDK